MKQTITHRHPGTGAFRPHGARNKGLFWTCYSPDINMTQPPPRSLLYSQRTFLLYTELKFSREKIVLIYTIFFIPAHAKAVWGLFVLEPGDLPMAWAVVLPETSQGLRLRTDGCEPKTFSSRRMWNTAGPWLHTCNTSVYLHSSDSVSPNHPGTGANIAAHNAHLPPRRQQKACPVCSGHLQSFFQHQAHDVLMILTSVILLQPFLGVSP